jgi:nitroreductase
VETWDAIRSRRNVRSYGEGVIAPQDLDRILEAGRRAPSAGNQQRDRSFSAAYGALIAHANMQQHHRSPLWDSEF